MNWEDVAKSIKPLVGMAAPTILGMLGNTLLPGLGGAIGSQAGSLLASVLGVDPNPEAVAKAIVNDPDAASKITTAESEAAAKWPALAQIAQAQFESNAKESESINATMRAELAAGQKWWTWRNLYGYSVGIEATATSWVILYAIVFDQSIFKHVSDSLSFFLSWYGMRFGLLGYIHNGSSNEKIAAVTGEAPSMIKNIVKAVRGK